MARRTFLAGSSAAVCRAFYSMNSKQPAFYLDPNDFLSLFAAPGLVGATWSDPRFDGGLDWANATIEPALRMERLAGSEEFLMRSMPIIPL
jgi:ABC-type oligopeptide transport system substrate-binding subunit